MNTKTRTVEKKQEESIFEGGIALDNLAPSDIIEARHSLPFGFECEVWYQNGKVSVGLPITPSTWTGSDNGTTSENERIVDRLSAFSFSDAEGMLESNNLVYCENTKDECMYDAQIKMSKEEKEEFENYDHKHKLQDVLKWFEANWLDEEFEKILKACHELDMQKQEQN
ncbi:MAG: hypothetical protein ACYC9R_13025 [Nitrosotalea sp.]